MKQLLSCTCSARWYDLAPLLLRLGAGAIFTVHGYVKYQGGVEQLSGFLGSLGFPLPDLFAIILIAVELVGGIFLLVGLFTHWVAKLQVIVAFLALVLVHLNNGFGVANGGYEFVLLLLIVMIAIVILGPGKYSVDAHMLGKKGGSMPLSEHEK